MLARSRLLVVLFVAATFAPANAAALIINPPQTITHEVIVHVASDGAGGLRIVGIRRL